MVERRRRGRESKHLAATQRISLHPIPPAVSLNFPFIINKKPEKKKNEERFFFFFDRQTNFFPSSRQVLPIWQFSLPRAVWFRIIRLLESLNNSGTQVVLALPPTKKKEPDDIWFRFHSIRSPPSPPYRICCRCDNRWFFANGYDPIIWIRRPLFFQCEQVRRFPADYESFAAHKVNGIMQHKRKQQIRAICDFVGKRKSCGGRHLQPPKVDSSDIYVRIGVFSGDDALCAAIEMYFGLAVAIARDIYGEKKKEERK